MDLQASGRVWRGERVPLDTVIELRCDESDEVLEADGLDLGSGGLSMRASFIPPLGARLELQFRCPPSGDPVRAQGEVVWAVAEGHRSGAFGMRFLELDTKSATVIRGVVQPEQEMAPELEQRPRLATMRIDGLGAPIETDVRLSEPDRIVLEQELSFLQLGRGVEVDVPGRGKERGRIASVELRQGPLDVPTLVFGVLLDEVRAPEAKPQAEPVAAALNALDTWPERPIFVEAAEAAESQKVTSAVKRASREGNATHATVTSDEAEPGKLELSEEEHQELKGFAGTPVFVLAVRRTLVTLQILLKARLSPLLEQGKVSSSAWLGDCLPKAQRLWQQVLTFVSIQVARVGAMNRARGAEKRRTTAPAPRVQRSAQTVQSVLRDAKRMPDERPLPHNRRMLASALAVLGVGLGIYALAPRSEADRIPVRHRPFVPAEAVQAPATPSLVRGAEGIAPVALPPVELSPAGLSPAALSSAATGGPTAVAAAAILDPTAPASTGTSRVFGAPEVPNGRVFAIRMSGPVDSVEGDQREDGFTVRVPGRLALDRASPIATSHRAVARAMILNRGDYAELTVDFLPGLRPKYQVTAKDNAIEVTLERL